LAQGADVDFNDDWFDPEPPKVITKDAAVALPFGLGFETN